MSGNAVCACVCSLGTVLPFTNLATERVCVFVSFFLGAGFPLGHMATESVRVGAGSGEEKEGREAEWERVQEGETKGRGKKGKRVTENGCT